MSAPTRPAMRLLSSRLRQLTAKPSQTQRRSLSLARYSNPSKRAFTAAPSQPSFFVDPSQPQDAPLRTPSSAPRNPMDAAAAKLAHEEARQYHMRKIRFSAIGLILSVAGLGACLYNLDLDDMEQSQKRRGLQLDASSEANVRFQGKEVHVIGAGEGKRIVAEGQGEEIELVETGTSSVPHFPRTIYLPTSSASTAPRTGAGAVDTAQPNTRQNAGNTQNQEEYTLVGLGIRSVSFLSIQVYVAGMYVRTQDITALQEKLIHSVNTGASTLIPAEKEELQKRLLDPETSREIWTELLKVPGIKSAWRITPTRNTDFAHLRDGWITGITKQTRELTASLSDASPNEYESEEFGQAVREFKALFAGGKAPKGSIMILARDGLGALDVLFQAVPGTQRQEMQLLGRVPDERLGRLIWMNYLAGKNVSSEPARRGIVAGCVGFAGRPVGSVETMVT